MCGVWTWWWAWLWRWAVVVAVAVGVAVAVVVGVVVAVVVTSGGNCARSALTCLNCTTPDGMILPGGYCPGWKLCAQRTDLFELHNSGRHNLPGGYCPRREIVRAAH